MSNKTFADFCDITLNLHEQLIVNGRRDPNETFYKSLPICIVDAVFSIGVNYKSVERATSAFMSHFHLNISRSTAGENEYTIRDFLKSMNSFTSFEEAAEFGFCNRQRTSSRGGILKAEACYHVAKVFEKHGIDTLGDFNAYPNKSALDADICNVKGQGSGIMLKYLYMLAGKADEVKPDRHVISFMTIAFPQLTMDVKHHEWLKTEMEEAVKVLQPKYPQLTVRFLDFLIWEYQSKNATIN